jgi:hypothetical protein
LPASVDPGAAAVVIRPKVLGYSNRSTAVRGARRMS